MELTRREWFKSALSVTASVGISSTLIAAPVSKAEEKFFKSLKPSTRKDQTGFKRKPIRTYTKVKGRHRQDLV
jgi:hypothetical protein